MDEEVLRWRCQIQDADVGLSAEEQETNEVPNNSSIVYSMQCMYTYEPRNPEPPIIAYPVWVGVLGMALSMLISR